MEQVIVFLCIYIALREAFFQYTQHKLINKLMSKNFADYQATLDKKDLAELNLIKNLKELGVNEEQLAQELEQQKAYLAGIR